MKIDTYIAFVLDRSGSMESVAQDTMDGFNKFLADQQKQPGEALMSLYQFDHEYQTVYEGMPLKDCKPLTRQTYEPRGTTALLDAVGRTIVHTEVELDKLAEKPKQVLVVVATDGYENASQEWSKARVVEAVNERKEWTFVFMGSDIDAFGEAGSMGIQRGSTMGYSGARGQTMSAFASLSSNTTAYRSSGITGQSMSYFEQDQTDADKEGDEDA